MTVFFFKAAQFHLFDDPVRVQGHTRRDGAYIAPHMSRRRRRHDPAGQARRRGDGRADRAAREVDTDPSDAQKAAGNYKKGHVTIQGIDIAIENPRGSKRYGIDPNGKAWGQVMAHHYGYVKRSEGADGDAVDVFIGPDEDADTVYVIDQLDQNGGFDEHKAMLGFDSLAAAERGYRANYAPGWRGMGKVTPMSVADFKQWLKREDTTKAAADSKTGEFRPTHELADGTRVVASADEPNIWIDAHGNEIEDEHAIAIRAEHPAPPAGPLAFGVAPGTSKAERRRINDAVRDRLALGGDYTEADKALLRQYSGRGGCGDSLNEYYTPADVAAGIWTALRNMGLADNAKVLEPSCGTGVFLHTALPGAKVTGVEMDATSSGVAKILHPGHEVHENNFEGFATTDVRQFDAAVGNPPFGLRGALLAADKKQRKRAETYFLDACVDKVKPHGLVALVLPAGVMDGSNNRSFRAELLAKAEFLGAKRMPNSAFSASHTDVTTDVVFLRRRDPQAQAALAVGGEALMREHSVWDDEFVGGGYFAGRGVDHVLGTPEPGWRAKAGMGDDFTVSGSMAGVADAIAAFTHEHRPVPTAGALMANMDQSERAQVARAAAKPAYEYAEVGATKTVDGVLYRLEGDPPRWHRVDAEEGPDPAVEAGAAIAADLQALFAGGEVDRDGLIARLDALVAEHGAPGKNPALIAAARENKTLHRLIGAVRADGSYSDLVTGHQAEAGPQSLGAAAEHLAAVAPEFTAQELALHWGGGDTDAVTEHLMASTRWALAADGVTWASIDDYLSGNLWDKRDALTKALEAADIADGPRAKWQQQLQAIDAAIDPKSLEDVEITVSSGWIAPDILAAWFNAVIDDWKEQHPGASWTPEYMQIEYADGVYTVTGGMHNSGLLSKHLNRLGVRKDDRRIIEAWDRDFKAWLCASAYRDEIEEAYNRKFRGFVSKRFSDEPMEVPGLREGADINAYHWAGLRWALRAGKGIIAADVGVGKAQPLDAKILTPTGWRSMGDLIKGDQVIAGDGSATEVLGVYPQGEREIYRVEFSDGAATECCDEHLWLTQTVLDCNNARRGCADLGRPKPRALSEIRESLRYRNQKNHKIPMAGAVEFVPQDLPIDPYVFGVLLGDGALKARTPSFTNPSQAIADAVSARLPAGYILSPHHEMGKCSHYKVVRQTKKDRRNRVADVLAELGANVGSASKYIPDIYLHNTTANRLALLQGLMDTDGYVDARGITVQFSSSSEALAKGVQFIAQSLGANANIKSKIPHYTHNGERRTGLRHYTVHLRLPPDVEPFAYCPEKRARVRPKSKYLPTRFITSVTPAGRKPAQCIAVAHPDQLYVTDDFLVTHNTPRGLMLARLLKAQGRANKPAIVAPKSVLANWYAEIENWFPGANVMVVGETYARDKNGELKGKSDDKATRERKLHEISQNDYDFVLISEPVWNELDLDPITKGEYHNEDFWVQRADALGQANDKRREKIRTAYDQAIANREFSKRTDVIYVNELGVDALVIDEAHHAKNLFSARSRWGAQPKFLGGSGLSNRALDTNLKARWILGQNGGYNVFGLSATPTKNSPLEIYSMLHHVAPEAFAARGIKNSEDFIDRYCAFTDQAVLSTKNEIKSALVTSGFKNLDELRQVMNQYIDRTTAADVGLKLPEAEHLQHLIDMSADQKAVYADLREAAEKSRGKSGGDAHIFSIMDKMAKAATDLALLDPGAHRGAESPKYAAAAKQIVAGAKQGGQVVFVDYIGAHDRLKAQLVAAGMNADEIAIVNAGTAKSSAARQTISDKFNAGKLRVVIGNTPTMGEGMNLQKNTSDIHHLDITWDPSSMQQRNGRGLRQGNKQERVRIHSYLSKGSFDGYRYQAMTGKKDWMEQLWHGGDRVENLAREGALSKDDLMIMLSADPEAAREALAGNKAELAERAKAKGMADAGDAFARLQSMQASMRKMKDKGTPAAQRLASGIDVARARLRENPHFTAKAALDHDGPAVLAPSGQAFHAGVAFEMKPGPGAPLNYSDKPSKWVVTSVDAALNKVRMRLWGEEADEGYTYAVNASKMAEKHIKPFDYDPGAEQRAKVAHSLAASTSAAIAKLPGAGEQEQTALKNAVADAVANAGANWHRSEDDRNRLRAAIHQAAARATGRDESRGAADSIYRAALLTAAGVEPGARDFIHQLRQIPDDALHEIGDDIQHHIDHGMRSYHIGWSLPTPLLDDEGNASLAPYFHATKAFDQGKKFMLPTAENRRKAIHAFAAAELRRQWEPEYRTARGRTTNMGDTPVYDGSQHDPHAGAGNPWKLAGNALFGPTFEADARAHLNKHHAEAIAAAPSLAEAVTMARRRDELTRASSGQRQRSLHPEAALALFDRAKAGGWLDEPWPTSDIPAAAAVTSLDKTVRAVLAAQPRLAASTKDAILEQAA